MIEQIILGIVQGIVEWLPVSSEGLIFLIKTNFFPSQAGIKEIASQVLFLHLGTFLAALIYFWKDIVKLLIVIKEHFFSIKKIKEYKNSQELKEKKEIKILFFLVITTFISGIFGFGLLIIFDNLSSEIDNLTKFINIGIGSLLVITGLLQIRSAKILKGFIKLNKNFDTNHKADQQENVSLKKDSFLQVEKKFFKLKLEKDIKNKDSVILGFTQGFAALPGFSRSGLTVSALLLRGFKKDIALKLSFLMSLPIVLAGNIVLNFDKFNLSLEAFLGLLMSFIFGYLTIGILLKLANKINFGWFVFGFGILTVFSVFI